MKHRSFSRSGRLILSLIALAILITASSVLARGGIGKREPNPGLFFVDYRHLSGGKDGVALIDLNPESKHFGKIMQRKELGVGVTPHHLYFNRDESRLYTTALGGSMLYEVILDKGRDGVPRITRFVPIDTGGNVVGEDMFFSADGSRFYMTFMGGQGGDPDGTIGVFDARTNELLDTIQALPTDAAPGQPFLSHPHGISANEQAGVLMVTSTIHPAGDRNVGNSISVIDLATNEVIQTQTITDGPDAPTQPVEILLLRDDLPPYALVSTINGGDVWIAPYDADTGELGTFTEVVNGAEEGLGVALEFYIHSNHHGERELFVSFGVPGVVKVYSLDDLPNLTLKRTLQAGAGAHHMAFFETQSGRELIVVQNNLLNIPGLNGGTISILDAHTGETVATFDMAGDHGLMPESIESALGHGADLHH
jgi:WD40 repeat protein